MEEKRTKSLSIIVAAEGSIGGRCRSAAAAELGIVSARADLLGQLVAESVQVGGSRYIADNENIHCISQTALPRWHTSLSFGNDASIYPCITFATSKRCMRTTSMNEQCLLSAVLPLAYSSLSDLLLLVCSSFLSSCAPSSFKILALVDLIVELTKPVSPFGLLVDPHGTRNAGRCKFAKSVIANLDTVVRPAKDVGPDLALVELANEHPDCSWLGVAHDHGHTVRPVPGW